MKTRLFFIVLHAVAAGLALRFAFLLRFYFDPLPFVYDEMLIRTLPVAMGVRVLCAEGFGLTRRVWRYASFRDLRPVVLAAAAGSVVLAPVTYWMEGARFPNGPLLLDFLISLGLITGIRFSGRFWEEIRRLRSGTDRASGVRVLIVGAGDRGEMALRFLQTRNRVVGFVDDAPDLQNRLMMGVPVLGTVKELFGVLEKHPVDELVIALAEPGPEKIRAIFAAGAAAGCEVSLMPERSPAAPVHGNPIRELRMSDFLGREAVQLDPAPLRSALGGMTVLVTGAGGSIGSELCRQIARLPVAKLLMLDVSENALFEISEELRSEVGERRSEVSLRLSSGQEGQGAEVGGRKSVVGNTHSTTQPLNHSTPFIEVILCDIRFPEDLREVFERHRPEVVVHAAACKHVPMMEAHPLEAARTNVLGTRTVVRLAREFGVRRLLHVSTDKVVEAEGVMGVSKAWGERIVREAGYSCVRFGNVLGSSGSVIPLFEKQWSRQGFLQLTHPEATRYFMTIEEAVLLILHAEALQGEGEVYILDMGEPVRIFDLARQMLRMRGSEAAEDGRWEIEDGGSRETGDGRRGTGDGGAGYSPTSNSHPDTRHAAWSGPTPAPKAPPGIRIIGLRPGERIHERLHTPSEKLEPTPVPKVNKLCGRFEAEDLETHLLQLEQAVASRDPAKIRGVLFGEASACGGGDRR